MTTQPLPRRYRRALAIIGQGLGIYPLAKGQVTSPLADELNPHLTPGPCVSVTAYYTLWAEARRVTFSSRRYWLQL